MRKFILLLSVLSFVIVFQGCKKSKPLYLSAKYAPLGKLNILSIDNEPGGATINYSLPSGADWEYVVARLTDSRGKKREIKIPADSDHISIEQLGDTTSLLVGLFASTIGDKKRSQPVVVTIHPLQPLFWKLMDSLSIEPTYGGLVVNFVNKDALNFSIGLVVKDPKGNVSLLDSYTPDSSIKRGSHAFRGYPAEERQYGVFVTNEAGNASDTLYKMITPYFEEMMDKSKFKEVDLPGDAPMVNAWNISMAFAWDGYWSQEFDGAWYGNYTNVQTASGNTTDPTWITFDMGSLAHLTHFVIHPYWRYERQCMKKFEIWGKAEIDGSGSWNGWIKLGTYEVIKPSGLPLGQYTQADSEAWLKGWADNFKSDAPAVRYIRIKCLENYMGGTDLNFQEITLWGVDK